MSVHSSESDTATLAEELKRRVAGEVRFDKMTRVLYSTDSSIYQIEPIGVVIPRTADDVVAVIEVANRYQVPVLPRGGGTSLAGQTVGHAIVIDFSKYMRGVLEVNAEEGWVRTLPGITLDELNHHLAAYGVLFAPDPSTSNRANVGGAIGNNSCGAHSIVWGKTIDNVEELDVVLSNGDTARFGPLTQEQLEAKMGGDSLEAETYRRLVAIGKANRDEVLARYPKILRRVGGYNLDEIVGDGVFNMARFVVGSEGTLVAVTQAKLRVVPRPKAKALAVVHFKELLQSMEATATALETEPAAVELIGGLILRQARTNLVYSRMMDFVEGDPDAVLVVELAGETQAEVEARVDDLERRMRRTHLAYAVRRVTKPEDQARVWAVRKAGLGLMMNVTGDAKPLPFVEDTAVAPNLLTQFVMRFNEIINDHGTTAGYYGHASVGCLHIRPMVDLKRQEGVDQMASIAAQVSDLVLEYGGAMSGEHGDGLARSYWNEKMFGPQIYSAFREVKRAFDPGGIMNPGKIVDAPPMTENLRISPSYIPRSVDTTFGFSEEGGFAGAIEMCNGQGACRKVLDGTMCPSFIATRDEEHSTRGRANALRAAISGALPGEALTSKRLHDVLDLCLECKGCKAECPSNVDLAKLKYEFLDKYHKANGTPLRSRFFGDIALVSRWGSFFAPLSNWALKLEPFRDLLDRYAGIDRRRPLPEFVSQTFIQWFRARGGSRPAGEARGDVVLLPDTFTNYNCPEVGRAAVKVLERLDFRVVLPQVKCCGRPMLSKGLLDRAKRNAQFNVASVYPYVSQGAKLVGLEPSCILSFRDDYPDLVGDDPRARTVAENTMMVDQFVAHAQTELGAVLDFKKSPGKLLVHGHCHQKALVGTQGSIDLLRSVPGCDPVEIKSGCCGMAGSFGFEKEHYDVSMKIGEEALFPAIRSEEGDFAVVTDGISCRQQVEHGTGMRARHLAEVLADSL